MFQTKGLILICKHLLTTYYVPDTDQKTSPNHPLGAIIIAQSITTLGTIIIPIFFFFNFNFVNFIFDSKCLVGRAFLFIHANTLHNIMHVPGTQ